MRQASPEEQHGSGVPQGGWDVTMTAELRSVRNIGGIVMKLVIALVNPRNWLALRYGGLAGPDQEGVRPGPGALPEALDVPTPIY